MIIVTAAIIQKQNCIFAARRAVGDHLEGLWEFPGGKLEPGESPEACLARELTEEFGIETEVGKYLGESVFDYGEKIIKLLAYQVTHVNGEFQLNDHDEMRWLARAEIYDVDWAPADIPLLETALSLIDEK
ncbi:MAG: 8-oxo-dGTP diphosphatase MutT [Gammaproteobacteria bacterium]|nr:MAG: 8-oxo-dGTP diphosphatase MutT [Gammaproteobacteria bacterium]